MENLEHDEKSLDTLNTEERERAWEESTRSLEERQKDPARFEPTDTERRIGVYREMLEPQVRDAIIKLTEKGYETIDSGYNPREKGTQYIGFRKKILDKSLLGEILKNIPDRGIVPEVDSDERSDYLLLRSSNFLTLEEWASIWEDVVSVFPDRKQLPPIKQRFISKKGH